MNERASQTVRETAYLFIAVAILAACAAAACSGHASERAADSGEDESGWTGGELLSFPREPLADLTAVEQRTVTLTVTQVDLPPDTLTIYPTRGWAQALASDETGAVWVTLGTAIVRLQDDGATYELAQPPEELSQHLDEEYCPDLARAWGYPGVAYMTECITDAAGATWFWIRGSRQDKLASYDGDAWRSYTVSDGLVDDEILDLFLDADGVLWIATASGISRYDGESWASFGPDEGLPAGRVAELASAPDGALWAIIVHPGDQWGDVAYALARFDGQAWLEHEVASEWEGWDFLTDSTGSLWLLSGLELLHLEGEAWQRYSPFSGGEAPVGTYIHGVEMTPEGIILVTASTGLIRIEEGASPVHELRGQSVNDLLIGPDGTIWLATDQGVLRANGDNWETCELRGGPDIDIPLSIHRDAHGNLWFGGFDGLASLDREQNWQTYPDVGSQAPLLAFANAPDGELWGAGCAGIYRFKGTAWQPVVDRWNQDLEDPIMGWCATEVALGPDDAVWVNQLDLFLVEGHGAVYLSGRSHEWYAPGRYTPAEEEARDAAVWHDGLVVAIAVQADGTAWFATTEGVFRFDGAEWATLPDSITGNSGLLLDMTVAPSGELWFGGEAGLARFDGVVWTDYPLSDDSPLSITALTSDEDGVVWFVTDREIGRFDGETLTLLRPRNYNGARDLAFGPDGTLWMVGGLDNLQRLTPPGP